MTRPERRQQLPVPAIGRAARADTPTSPAAPRRTAAAASVPLALIALIALIARGCTPRATNRSKLQKWRR